MRAFLCALIAAAVTAFASPAFAQGGGIGGGQTTTTPPLDPASINAALSGPSAIFDLGSKFLRDNADQAKTTLYGPGANNPGGGGADLAVGADGSVAFGPRYRFWGELYGVRAQTGAQGTFTGDERKTWGGIAGLGATLAPGVHVGVSVDQGRTDIDIDNLPQSSRIDLTQIGANAIFESGPWSLAFAGIYGFGGIRSERFDAGGPINSNYDADLWGAIAEVSYYWSSGSWRVVPKIGIDWTQISVDPFIESGGAIPISATAQDTRRLRAFAGVETGYSWFSGQTLYDIGVYGRVIDILSQDVDSVLAAAVNGNALPRVIPGIVDDRFEFNGGVSTTVRFSDNARIYLIYDARLRDGFSAHAGTVGLELRW